LLRAAAESNLKGLVLELGGKAPLVVFEDADIDTALDALVFSAFYNQGQTCTAATRLLVQSTVLDQIMAGLKERLSRIEVGDPRLEGTSVGPLISRAQYEKVVHFIEIGISGGVELVVGGSRPKDLDKGYYLEPTVFLNPPLDSPLVKEEIFGPVLVVNKFDDESEALCLANDSEYGLAASVWTKDSARLHRFAHELQAGIIWGNTVFSEHPGAPAGGYRESGVGREFGASAIDEYTQLKSVWIDLSGEHFEWV
jgi:betaine-aldehyde dehydrogenase